jgi:signal transduction histidine kinase
MPALSRLLPKGLPQFYHSVRFRLTVWSVFILAVVLLIFSAFIYTRQLNDLNHDALDRLEVRSHQVADLFRFASASNGNVGELQFPGLAQGGLPFFQASDAMALVDPQGKILQKIGPVTDTIYTQLITNWEKANPAATSQQMSGVLATGSSHTKYLYLLTPVDFEGSGHGILIMGSPLDPGGQLPRLLLTLWLGSLAILVIAMAGGYWLAGRVMRPVKTITHTARLISETDLTRRLNLGTRDELGELADTFDQMITRLQAAFERQRQFTADASHELRTPLTIVELETSRALSHRRNPEEYERTLMVIQSENETMARLVNELLTLARMDAGGIVLKEEILDLSDVALEVVERLAPLARRSGVTLSTGDLPEVKISGDRQYLIQMLTNLVENGIKYSGGAQERQVRVETGLQDNGRPPTGWVKVTDNGAGIPAEHLPHLFDRFYQVDSARTRPAAESEDGVPSGSGLGLSIVQWIAHAHHGNVNVTSQPGQGTTFEVRLPLAAGKTPAKS